MFIVLGLGSASFDLIGAEVAILPFVLLAVFGFIVIMPMAVLRRWVFYRRRLKNQTITAEYEPPLGLNPAEIGYLFDGKLRELEVGATIIGLIQRGLLHIKKVDHKKKIFAGPKVEEKTYRRSR